MSEENLLKRLKALCNNKEIDDFEFVKELAKIDKEVLDSRSDDDYEINRPQYEKLLAVVEFFTEEAKDNSGMDVKPVTLSPRMVCGGVEVEFEVLDLSLKELERFKEIVNYASAIDIDVSVEGKACMGITIPDVFVRKK